MCGIVGRIARHLPEEQLVASVWAAAGALSHRGPDDEGVWHDPSAGVGLGHRRLSIIDLSDEGAQPMESECGRWVIVYNGEIYNFPALRVELESRRVRFRGSSDTEVLLQCVASFGVREALRRCNGMFAFALWDRRERMLTLARDRLGQKPLYYSVTASGFVFGSELRALRGFDEVSFDIDPNSLAEFLGVGYVRAPRSIHPGIKKLQPGTFLQFSSESRSCQFQSYWTVEEVSQRGTDDPFPGSFKEAADELESLLSAAVGRCMVSDVSIGAFLSGGIDSSIVSALMQTHASRPVRTFSLGFKDPAYDESGYAQAVSARLETDHTVMIATERDALEVIPLLPRIWDEPFADSSQIPTYLVSKMARECVSVALSGDGGDEVFGGYSRYSRFGWLRRLGRVPQPVRDLTAGAMELSAGVARVIALGRAPTPTGCAGTATSVSHRASKMAGFLRDAGEDADVWWGLMSLWPQPERIVKGALMPERGFASPNRDAIRRCMYHDMSTYLPGDILTKVDRASMAVSLEARVPLLDHTVVEFVARLPVDYLRPGGSGKRVLREVLSRYLEPELFNRPKRGFALPVREWLRGELRDWAEELLSEESLERTGLLRAAPIRASWSEHLAGTRNWQHGLWSVLMFQAWVQEWSGARG